jgi:hypothetical protein
VFDGKCHISESMKFGQKFRTAYPQIHLF